jgi:Ca-activated chloride channel family protein
MRLAGTSALLLVVAALPALRAQQPFADPPSFRSASTELVVLPVTVTDRRGGLVSDLPRDRFTVFDNGRRQDVALFTNEDIPVSVGLVLDNSGSMRGKLGEVVAAALAFAGASNPDDELFTLEFSDDVKDALPGRRLLANDITGLRLALTALVPAGRTALYDALIAGLDRLSEGTRARRVLVLISDGGDNASASTLREVLARARASNVTIYTIGVYERDDPDANARVLKSIAETTGGERFLPESPGPLLSDCQRIAREIRSGYTIGYVPPDRDGTFHHVRVQVDASDGRKLNVRTRPGYFAAGVQAHR